MKMYYPLRLLGWALGSEAFLAASVHSYLRRGLTGQECDLSYHTSQQDSSALDPSLTNAGWRDNGLTLA